MLFHTWTPILTGCIYFIFQYLGHIEPYPQPHHVSQIHHQPATPLASSYYPNHPRPPPPSPPRGFEPPVSLYYTENLDFGKSRFIRIPQDLQAQRAIADRDENEIIQAAKLKEHVPTTPQQILPPENLVPHRGTSLLQSTVPISQPDPSFAPPRVQTLHSNSRIGSNGYYDGNDHYDNYGHYPFYSSHEIVSSVPTRTISQHARQHDFFSTPRKAPLNGYYFEQ